MSIDFNFDNSFSRLPERFYSRVEPQRLNDPELISLSPDAANLLGLDAENLDKKVLAEIFSGNLQPEGSDPIAMIYSGHQFGVYVPQLGDGRAVMLGEVRNTAGEKWDVQLKGAGMTPYSRMADGRAVLRSCVREYLCSEAMQALGVPTTRALCLVGSKDPVRREEMETAAVMTRLSPSHVRFGSFEYFYYTKQTDALLQLADHVIEQHFDDWQNLDDKYLRLFDQAVANTAKLIAQWQTVGFCHGVMNTDNMSILGLTLDYGPFGFMEEYTPAYVCNHSDVEGRYAYFRQPTIGLFNLSCLAEAFTPMLSVEQLKASLSRYELLYIQQYLSLMRQKIGLATEVEADDGLIADLLKLLYENQIDYSIFFRQLAEVSIEIEATPLRDEFKDLQGYDNWLARYRARLKDEKADPEERAAKMNRVNPKYILRNYMAHQAINEAREGKYEEVDRLLRILSNPFDEQPEFEKYAQASPVWGKELEVSCSS